MYPSAYLNLFTTESTYVTCIFINRSISFYHNHIFLEEKFMNLISRFRRQPRIIAVLVLVCTLVLSIALIASSHIITWADQGGSKTNHYGPIRHSTSTDSGTCGPDWANDTFNRSFTINKSTPNTV